MQKLLLLLSFVLFSLHIQAKKVDATIYFTDTLIQTKIVLPNDFTELQKKVVVLDANGQKVTLMPQQGIHFEFYTDDNVLVQMFSLRNTIKNGEKQDYLFMRLVVDAEKKLFKYYKKSLQPIITPESVFLGTGMDAGISIKELFYILEDDETLTKVKEKKLNQDMKRIFGNCPGLIGKQKYRVLDDQTLHFMTKYYNRNCVG